MKSYPEINWTDQLVKKFWDYESQFVSNYFTFQVGRSVVEELREYFPQAKTVLDYGCGLGFLMHHLLDKGFNVSGLEFSEESIRSVAELFNGRENFQGVYGLELIEKNKKFDLIFVAEVIEHLSDDYLRKTVENLSRLLSPDGKVIFTTPHAEDRALNMVFCPQCEHTFHRWQHVRSWSIDSLRLYLEGTGFKVIDAFATNFGSRPIEKVRAEEMSKRSYPFQEAPHLVTIAKIAT